MASIAELLAGILGGSFRPSERIRAAIEATAPEPFSGAFGVGSPAEEAGRPRTFLDDAVTTAFPFSIPPQPEGEPRVLHRAGGGVTITDRDLARGMDAALAVSGGGLGTSIRAPGGPMLAGKLPMDEASRTKGENSYVWTSIPDKVTEQLRRLGYDGILDTGGKMGGQGHTVAIPFGPEQVRSQFAKFDPKNEGKSMLLGALTTAAPVGFLASRLSREEQ